MFNPRTSLVCVPRDPHCVRSSRTTRIDTDRRPVTVSSLLHPKTDAAAASHSATVGVYAAVADTYFWALRRFPQQIVTLKKDISICRMLHNECGCKPS